MTLINSPQVPLSNIWIRLTFIEDPHEDRWNRLAVSSKKNDMKSVDVDERLDDYISFSRHNISAGLSFQNQAYKDLSKQEDKLKSFSKTCFIEKRLIIVT